MSCPVNTLKKFRKTPESFNGICGTGRYGPAREFARLHSAALTVLWSARGYDTGASTTSLAKEARPAAITASRDSRCTDE